MELGKTIKQLRLKSGLTQEQLGNQLGVGAQAVSKWENGLAMPDIALLPSLSTVFGVSIDELFSLTTEQKLDRIERRLDVEGELSEATIREYDDFLKVTRSEEKYRKRASELLAYLYWRQMDVYAGKVRRYAKEAIYENPSQKGCQYMLDMAAGQQAWDWNISNHSAVIAFYKDVVAKNPEAAIAHMYLIDNLIADHRCDEAEEALKKYGSLPNANPIMVEVYRAHIHLARFDEKKAEETILQLLELHPNESACLFEVAQYYAKKAEYPKAIEYYERSFASEKRRPRFTDELQGIADIYELMEDYPKAVQTYDRIIRLMKDEWGMSEEIELKTVEEKRDALTRR